MSLSDDDLARIEAAAQPYVGAVNGAISMVLEPSLVLALCAEVRELRALVAEAQATPERRTI